MRSLGPIFAATVFGASTIALANAFPPPSSTRITPTIRPLIQPYFETSTAGRVRLSSPRGGAQGQGPKVRGTLPTSLSVAPFSAFDGALLSQSVGTLTAANVLGFFISLVTKTQVHLDLLGTGAFALSAIPALMSKVGPISSLTRVKVSCGAVMIWGAKLAAYLFYRALKRGEDTRLVGTLSTFSGTREFNAGLFSI